MRNINIIKWPDITILSEIINGTFRDTTLQPRKNINKTQWLNAIFDSWCHHTQYQERHTERWAFFVFSVVMPPRPYPSQTLRKPRRTSLSAYIN